MLDSDILYGIKIELGITDDSEDALLENLIERSKLDILNKMYPFVSEFDETYVVPDKYLNVLHDIVIYRYNKIGIQGQVAHDEGEISRSYDGAGIPRVYLKQVKSKVGTP